MTTYYLIRHAEAEGNLYRRAHGQFDSNITENGRRQTAALAERFRTVPVDAVWSSDLVRAQSTATALLKYHPHLRLHTDPALREVLQGAWEDRPWGEIAREQPGPYWAYTHEPERWSVPGSESADHVAGRLEQALLGLADAYPGKTLAVVSHAFAIRLLASRLMGSAFAETPFGDNTAVTTLTAENGNLTLQDYADGSHLGSLSTFARQGLAGDHLGQKANGRFEPLRLPKERELFTRCYADTWMASHGDLTGFVPSLYVRAATKLAKADERCLVKILYGEELAGIIELDPERGAQQGRGWISLLWVEPSHRGRRFGAQLVGHAVSFFRRRRRQAIQLHVSQTNETAIGFYKAMGFRAVGQTEGVGGMLYLMEMDITPRVWRLP